jgi:hypothetical protein
MNPPIHATELLIEAEKLCNSFGFSCFDRADTYAEFTDPWRRSIRLELAKSKHLSYTLTAHKEAKRPISAAAEVYRADTPELCAKLIVAIASAIKSVRSMA